MEATIEALLFFMLCADEDLHPDIAVKQVEYLTNILQRLTADDRDTFLTYATAMGEAERVRWGPSERVEHLFSLGAFLGLIDKDE
jgi:hypothetical protein